MYRIASFCLVMIALVALGGNLEAANRSCPNGNCPNTAAMNGASFELPASFSFVEAAPPRTVDASHDLLTQLNKGRADRGLYQFASHQQPIEAVLTQKTRVERPAQVATLTTRTNSTVKAGPAQANGPVRRLFAWLFH